VLTAHAGRVRLPVPSDFHAVFLVAAALTFAGALMALRIRDEDAAGTMRSPEPVVEPLAPPASDAAVEF
jgi:hypothetical protein